MDQIVQLALPIHICAAVVWLGSALGFHGFVEPAAERAGAHGDRMLLAILCGPFTPVITIAALTTIAAGAVLYAHVAAAAGVHVFLTGHGLGYTLGAAATLLALGIACTITGPNTLRLIRLARGLAASGWEITPRRASVLHDARRRLSAGGRVATTLLGTALIAMCLAR